MDQSLNSEALNETSCHNGHDAVEWTINSRAIKHKLSAEQLSLKWKILDLNQCAVISTRCGVDVRPEACVLVVRRSETRFALKRRHPSKKKLRQEKQYHQAQKKTTKR